MNICLIGVRGVGKTKTARRLAILLRRPVLSTDALVSYECDGKSVAAIIRQKGGGPAAWRFFRNIEFVVLKKISKMKDVILDCGGGIVVDLDSRGREKFSARKVRILRKNAVVVWLKADPARLHKKIIEDPRRPMLSASDDPVAIMRRRSPFYARAAHVVIPIAAGLRPLRPKPLAKRLLRILSPRLNHQN